jgi:hypothetical protein
MVSSSLEATVAAWKQLWQKGAIREDTNKQNTTTKKKTTTKTKQRRNKKETMRAYQQRTILGENLELRDVEEFGDLLQAKLDDVLRIGLHNLANLSQEARTSKSRQLIDYIVQKSFDLFLMMEVGLCWRKVGNEDQWYERILGKFRASRSIFANNVTELQHTKPLQPGGVGIIATDDVAHRVTSQGKDPTGLGRWAWIRLQGRNGVRT